MVRDVLKIQNLQNPKIGRNINSVTNVFVL